MEPYYLILRLPGEPKEEFVLLIPFRPARRTTSRRGWRRERPAPLWELVVYNFPKQN